MWQWHASLLNFFTGSLFTCLIIRIFQLVFSVGTVFSSHNKSIGTVFQLIFSAKRTELLSSSAVLYQLCIEYSSIYSRVDRQAWNYWRRTYVLLLWIRKSLLFLVSAEMMIWHEIHESSWLVNLTPLSFVHETETVPGGSRREASLRIIGHVLLLGSRSAPVPCDRDRHMCDRQSHYSFYIIYC